MNHREARRGRTHRFRGQASCILDAEGHFINVSPSLSAFLRRDGASLRGLSFLSCLDSGAADQVRPLLARAARARIDERFQVRMLDATGEGYWVMMHVASNGLAGHVAAFFERP